MGNHRADRSSRRAAASNAERPTSAGGRRRAEKPRRSASLPTTGRGIPALPTVIGATAIIAAGAGAVGLSSNGVLDGASENLRLSAGASSLTGTDSYTFASTSTDTSPRERAISRDSERQALRDAADKELKAEAEAQNRQRNAALASLAKSAEERASEIKQNQWGLPTSGYHLTARFGMAGGLWSSNHTGLDFAAPTGTPIAAIANGVITDTSWAGAYGNRTILTLDDGTEIWYCHQSSINVSVGEKVVGGQQIGAVGSTGNSTGPHLHLEVRPGGGDPVDPYTSLVYHGVTP